MRHWADKWPDWDDAAPRAPQRRGPRPRVIDVRPPAQPGLRSWFRRQSTAKLVLLAFLTFYVLPWAILILGVLALYSLSLMGF